MPARAREAPGQVRPREGAQSLATEWIFRRILVLLDGSAFAEHALEPATALAHLMQAEVVLLQVIDSLPPTADEMEAAALQHTFRQQGQTEADNRRTERTRPESRMPGPGRGVQPPGGPGQRDRDG
jgi:Universal stress protein family